MKKVLSEGVKKMSMPSCILDRHKFELFLFCAITCKKRLFNKKNALWGQTSDTIVLVNTVGQLMAIQKNSLLDQELITIRSIPKVVIMGRTFLGNAKF